MPDSLRAYDPYALLTSKRALALEAYLQGLLVHFRIATGSRRTPGSPDHAATDRKLYLSVFTISSR